MNNNEVLSILISLSEGIDPESKTRLSEKHILNRPSIIRALCKAVARLENDEITPQSSWQISEESMLLKYFYSGFDLLSISNELGKSCEDISLKLNELDLSYDLKVA